jgi:hypothetical protein
MAGFGGSQPVDLSRASEMEVLAALVAVVCISHRRRPVRPVDEDVAPEASARELIASRLAILSERMRESGGDPDGRAVRDAQAAWAREQELITSDSVIATVQGVRATITHVGHTEARTALDDLQQQAADHPEGVPGYVVAAGRVRFDDLMRRDVQ